MGSGSGQARGEGMGALQRKRSDFRAPCTVHGSAAGTSAPRVFRDNTCLYWIKQIDQQSKQHETTPNARSANEVLWISPSGSAPSKSAVADIQRLSEDRVDESALTTRSAVQPNPDCGYFCFSGF
jgi:hypothetical protein